MPAPRMTLHVQLVLRALLAEPGAELYGLQVVRGAGLPSGTVYPILARLEAAGWLARRDEDVDPKAAGRPRRRFYALTPEGAGTARAAMERAVVQLAALGVTEAPRGTVIPETEARGEVPVVKSGRRPPVAVAVPFREPEPAARPRAKGPCEHRVPPGSYCRSCQRMI